MSSRNSKRNRLWRKWTL